MATYVAFLRGINVGGHTVTNDRLRELFEALAMDRVSTFLASGNVIFQTDEEGGSALEKRIEAGLRESLGYPVPTFARDARQVASLANHAPFPVAPEGGKLHIGLLRETLDRSTRAEVAALAADTDRVAFNGRELYWHVAGRYMDSALSGPAVGKVLGAAWTLRTATTLQRIANKLPS